MSLAAFQLDGKNALVTGSRRGIGAAVAIALAEAGAMSAGSAQRPAGLRSRWRLAGGAEQNQTPFAASRLDG